MKMPNLATFSALLLILFSYTITQAQENALDFDGVNDVVDLGNGPVFDIGTTFTFEAWVYPKSQQAIASIIFNKWTSGLEDKFLTYNPDGTLTFSLFGVGSLSTTDSIRSLAWTHVAATYDGSDIRIYINGVENISVSAVGDAADNSGTMYLGDNPVRPAIEGAPFDGLLDEVRFWNTARTANEILENADNSLNSGTGLVASYDFNSGTAGGNNSGITTLSDISGNSNNGTLNDGSGDAGASGFLLSGATSNWVASTAFSDINYGLNFDGVNEYVVSTANIPIIGAAPRTVELWYRNGTNSGVTHPITLGTQAMSQGFGFFLNNDELNFYGELDDYNTGYQFTDAQWHHLAITYDGSIVRTFVDGIETPTSAQPKTLNTGSNLMYLGTKMDLSAYSNSSIDEIRVWSTVREPSQLLAFKDVELTGSEPGLELYYQMSDGPGSISAGDLAASNAGNLTNMENLEDWVITDHDIGPSGILDTNPPAITSITSPDDPGPTSSSPFTATITFSEEVAGLELSDITVGNGIPTNLNASNGTVFTVDITPFADGNVTIDIAGGVVTDLTGNGNAAAAQYTILADVPSNALSFDGISDYIDIPDDTSLNPGLGGYTAEFWFKMNSIQGGNNFLLAKYGNGGSSSDQDVIQVYVADDTLRFGIRDFLGNEYNTNAPFVIQTNTWYHFAGVWDPNNLKMQMILNGRIADEVGTSSGQVNFASGNPLYIGAREANGSGIEGPSDFEIDELRIWKSARSESEIKDHLYGVLSNPGTESALRAYYQFDQTSGTLI
ncbi:MAG: hypothetical protein KI790_19450, partial [Cyclobacteriaceae bacterium]|nr:hypothetical protein [Cyclobacteriaceae bacterium HetDA_MAG_MS6]